MNFTLFISSNMEYFDIFTFVLFFYHKKQNLKSDMSNICDNTEKKNDKTYIFKLCGLIILNYFSWFGIFSFSNESNYLYLKQNNSENNVKCFYNFEY